MPPKHGSLGKCVIFPQKYFKHFLEGEGGPVRRVALKLHVLIYHVLTLVFQLLCMMATTQQVYIGQIVK